MSSRGCPPVERVVERGDDGSEHPHGAAVPRTDYLERASPQKPTRPDASQPSQEGGSDRETPWPRSSGRESPRIVASTEPAARGINTAHGDLSRTPARRDKRSRPDKPCKKAFLNLLALAHAPVAPILPRNAPHRASIQALLFARLRVHRGEPFCGGGGPGTDGDMSSPSHAYPSSYPSQHRHSPSFDPNTPPAPPPKPGSQEGTRQSTPAGSQPLPPPPPPHQDAFGTYGTPAEDPQLAHQAQIWYAQKIQDPGERWLPKVLEDKSKHDLADVLAKPELLAALAHATSTAHPTTAAAQEPLRAALQENIALASHLNELEARLSRLRSSTQAQLLSTHALERQWKQKQSEMDRALAPFAPSSLYQRLSQGVQEQEMVCRALEESFVEGDGGVAVEREVVEWIRRYREAKKVYYARRERKERWDEGRVGGWR